MIFKCIFKFLSFLKLPNLKDFLMFKTNQPTNFNDFPLDSFIDIANVIFIGYMTGSYLCVK